MAAVSPVTNGHTAPELPDFESFPAKYGWPTENERGYKLSEQLCGTERPMRVIHIGAGASGILMAKLLPETLKNVSFTCYEKNADVGGTWFENKYPGCACDIPSASYQFTFARNPRWSQFYSPRGEILQYLRDIVEAYDLRKHFKFKHMVTGATWDDEAGLWEVHIKDLETGESFIDRGEVLINGGGFLNNWKWPDIEGLHDFKGTLCHTANYDTKLELEGKRVAVIGIGSSGIQITATIAPRVGHLYTWVRSPTWVTAGFAQKFAGPNGTNFNYSEDQMKDFEENPAEYAAYCKKIENEMNVRFKFILKDTPDAIEAKKFSTKQMTEKLSGREDIIKKIIPTDFPVGCRRPTPGNGFLEALTLPHVTTFTEEMQRITSKGFIDHAGVEHEVDAIICATGFDTTFVPRFPVIGKGGQNLQDIVRDKPIAYFGIAYPEIPNYWACVGPYGPLGHGSFMPYGEFIYNHFLTIIKKIQVENIKSLTPSRSVCDALAEHADIFLKRTAWSSNCRSWFKRSRVDGPLAMFPGSRLTFLKLLTNPRYEDYDIDYTSGNPFNFLGNGLCVREFDGSDLSYYLGEEGEAGGTLPKVDKPKANGVVTNGFNA